MFCYLLNSTNFNDFFNWQLVDQTMDHVSDCVSVVIFHPAGLNKDFYTRCEQTTQKSV